MKVLLRYGDLDKFCAQGIFEVNNVMAERVDHPCWTESVEIVSKGHITVNPAWLQDYAPVSEGF